MEPVRLELTWPNKDRFLLVPKDDSGKPVWVDREHPAAHEVRVATLGDSVGEVPADTHEDNLLFTGDSLRARACERVGLAPLSHQGPQKL